MTSTITYTDSHIGGMWLPAINKRQYAVSNPATGAILAQVADCGSEETENAIIAAADAFQEWKKATASERSQLLMRWHHLIIQQAAPLAELITLESGKPLAEAKGEVSYGASFIEWFAEEAKRACGDIIPTATQGRKLLVTKQPVGVCAAITPWNFPLAMITRKVAPALAAGCTMVLKPAEATPLTALFLAALATEAGIPAGVFNVVTASQGKSVGQVLANHPTVRKLSFTGSTAVGKLLLKQSANTVKRVSMELGGNAPFIVFNDADIPKAVAGAMASKYRNAGQTCVCANRFYVQADVYDAFITAFDAAVKTLNVGDGLSNDVTLGPLINKAALKKVSSLVDDAIHKGAKVITGGAVHELGGNFYQPTVLGEVNHDMNIVHEEIFGPISPIIKFDKEQDVIAMANDTPYGLAAYFYANDLSKVWRVAEALEYGMIGINEGVISTAAAPFGGVKESGLGREGSQYGIDEYFEMKYLCMGGLS